MKLEDFLVMIVLKLLVMGYLQEGIRIFGSRTSQKHLNLLLVRFNLVDFIYYRMRSKPRNAYLYKTALSRRLLRFQTSQAIYCIRM